MLEGTLLAAHAVIDAARKSSSPLIGQTQHLKQRPIAWPAAQNWQSPTESCVHSQQENNRSSVTPRLRSNEMFVTEDLEVWNTSHILFT